MGFMGKKIHYAYYFSDASTVWTNYFNDEIVVSDAIEVPEVTDKPPIISFDITDTQVKFSFFDTGLFTLGIFNGPVLEDTHDVLNPITGFSLVTNMQGLTKRDISFSEDMLAIDFHGLSFTPTTYVWINVKFGPNKIIGTNDDDVLKGTNDNDWILGGKGKDNLYGISGNDVFAFQQGDFGKDSSSADTIFDFSSDKIDLTKIDANSKTGRNDTFAFIGADDFSKRPGELRLDKEKSDTWIYGDMNGDGKADLAIHLDDAVNLTSTSFYL